MNPDKNISQISHGKPFPGIIAIVTCCIDDWGGCEELWARSLPFLQSEGYNIIVYKAGLNKDHHEFVKLAGSGVILEELKPPPAPESLAFRVRRKIGRKLNPEAFTDPPQNAVEILAWKLKDEMPNLVIIAQGINFDGIWYAKACADLGLNYVIISQKAVDFYWPHHAERNVMNEVYRKASKSIFVSNHNLRITEEQLGFELKNAVVVFNPVKLARKIIPYPSTSNGYKLACIGRYFLLDKGQDILIRILATEKWRNRPVTVSFIGAGTDKEGLKELAEFLSVKNVEFLDYISNMEKVWESFHALILPSRSEGMALVLLEAMSAGRAVIVTHAGGNGEIVEEGVTGFIGDPFEESFSQAMERAWVQREEWASMGTRASTYIKVNVPELPEQEFANQLKMIING